MAGAHYNSSGSGRRRAPSRCWPGATLEAEAAADSLAVAERKGQTVRPRLSARLVYFYDDSLFMHPSRNKLVVVVAVFGWLCSFVGASTKDDHETGARRLLAEFGDERKRAVCLPPPC